MAEELIMTQIASNDKNSSIDEEGKFYQELDEKKSRNSCCTCQTLIILFVVILFFAAGGVYYLYRQITHNSLLNNNPKVATSTIDFSKKVDNIKTDNLNQFQIILTSDDLSNLLNSGYTTSNFILKDIRTSIASSGILIYGTLVKPLSSKITITTTVKVADGKIAIDAEKLTAGNINPPKIFINSVSSGLTGFLDQKMAILYKNYTIEKVELGENKMKVTGKIKK